MSAPTPPVFDELFQAQFAQLVAWRRDVRRFRSDTVKGETIDALLDLMQLAPSVGNSQPWRWVNVESKDARDRIREDFARCNAEALASYETDRAIAYARLKLEGLQVAPVQFAVFCDQSTDQGANLGRRTMPLTLEYSVAGMLATFWLTARSVGLGVGWVSILDPVHVAKVLQVSEDWKFIAYLCVGWPQEEHIDPELVRHGWQDRTAAGRAVITR
ncbi:5,6-dimethylbenzimidazole synthase [Bradyrhizobium jicamae]|uniref:5,6-dimethylbenzimidazole synthase n=1 Tax=Bradyrhizobium jicamae TaxID=280332 RepID=A0A0R3LUA3_9BRAD|nr:5,6-dimethylbenzimidazole synthase [Bradyrhizobium jicamae]